MSERLLIVGAGPLGREVLCWALQIPAGQRTWEVGGFLDDQPGILDGFALPANLLGAPATHVFEPRDRVVVAIGDPAQRRSMVELLTARGAQFTTLIHPRSFFGLNNRWGVGCVVSPGTVITTNVTIGDHVIIQSDCGIGHDAVVGNYCWLQPHAHISGRVRVAEGTLLGDNCGILPGVTIGEGAVVAVGSMVYENVAPHTSVAGVPARELTPLADPGQAAA